MFLVKKRAFTSKAVWVVLSVLQGRTERGAEAKQTVSKLLLKAFGKNL